MDKILFLLSEGIKNLWRHKLTVFAAVFSIFLSLSTIGVLFIAEQNTHKLIEYMRTKYKIEVFFQNDVTDVAAEQYVEQIKKIPGVYSTTLISKDETLKIYKSVIGEDLTQFLDYNPLPISCVVNVNRRHEGLLKIMTIIKNIENIDGVDSIRHQGRLINQIETFYAKGLLGLSAVAFAIIFVTVLIISNTIKLTIYSNKDLIKALRLIGATNTFIRLPFILEGIFQGIIGAIIASFFLCGSVYGANELLHQFTIYSINVNWLFLSWIFLIAFIISLIGSNRAISKFLK